jgi:hypothetical protein
MGKRTKQSFFKGRNQMAKKHMKKMLIIPGHKRNANQNHKRFHLAPVRMTPTKKQPTTNVGKDVGEKPPSYTAGGNVN